MRSKVRNIVFAVVAVLAIALLLNFDVPLQMPFASARSLFFSRISSVALASEKPALPEVGQREEAPAVQPENVIAQVTADIEKIAARRTPPVRITIPSIKLDSPVVGVGINKKGEMDVPDGSTRNVGWYKYGTKPGAKGSAVLDAHVFAAFSDLRYVKTGDDIYVMAESGERLHFVAQSSMVYKLGELTPSMLFDSDGTRRINLITCAGQPTADGSTYTERLVVSATLAS